MKSLGTLRHEGKNFLGFYSCGYRNKNGIRLRYFTDFIMSHTAFYKTCARNIAPLQGILGRVPTFTQIHYIVLSQELKPLLSISKSLSGTRVERYDRPTNTYIQLLMIFSCVASFGTFIWHRPTPWSGYTIFMPAIHQKNTNRISPCSRAWFAIGTESHQKHRECDHPTQASHSTRLRTQRWYSRAFSRAKPSSVAAYQQ